MACAPAYIIASRACFITFTALYRSLHVNRLALCTYMRYTEGYGGLVPSDFHEHWYWERKSTLQPSLTRYGLVDSIRQTYGYLIRAVSFLRARNL